MSAQISESARENGITGFVPVFAGVKNVSPVYRENFSDKFDISAESENVSDIVSSFGMNSNNTNRYTSHNGTVGYVENSGELKISPDGVITFESDRNGGVAMSKILGYLPEDIEKNTYGFSDTVGAVCSVLEALGTTVLGGEAELVLEYVGYDSGAELTSFGFRYYLGGVEIRTARENGADSDETYDAYFSFSDTALVGAKLRALCLQAQTAHIPTFRKRRLWLRQKSDGKPLVEAVCRVCKP